MFLNIQIYFCCGVWKCDQGSLVELTAPMGMHENQLAKSTNFLKTVGLLKNQQPSNTLLVQWTSCEYLSESSLPSAFWIGPYSLYF